MKIKAISLAVLLLLSAASHAGILNDLDTMFMSNSTASGVLNASDRTAVFGGSTHLRTPIRAVNLVSFDPPRISGGCGGIDLYGGSFTFISGPALIQTFRNVAANAIGLAFKAAIKGISPSLDSLMSEFQTLMQTMNNLGKNSCSLAHLLVDKGAAALASSTDGEAAQTGVKKGMFTDMASNLHDFNANVSGFLNNTKTLNPTAGNIVVKALTSTGATAPLDLGGMPNPDGSPQDDKDPNSLNNRVLLSLLGYQINATSCESQNQAGANPTTIADPLAIGQVACTGPHTITLQQLIDGGGPGSPTVAQPLVLYKCLDPSGTSPLPFGFDYQICTKMQAEDYPYSGISGWVNMNLFGSPSSNLITPASIMGQFTSGNSVTLTSLQLKFLQTTGIPLISLLSKTKDSERRIFLANKLGKHVTNCIAARIGSALFTAARQVKAHPTYHLNEEQLSRINILETQALDKERDCKTDRSIEDAVAMIVNQTVITGGGGH